MSDIKDFRLPDGSVLPHYEDHTGTWRALGCLPPRADFGGLPKFGAENEVIPRSDWREIDFSGYDAPILNQGQHGSCVGHGSATAFWRQWLMQGFTPQDFSACFIYGNINGGRDAGAIISDALQSMMQTGVALLSEVPEGTIYKGQFPPSAYQTAKRFRVKGAHHCQSFDEIVSALLLGRMVVYGIYVGGSFGNLDQYGVAPAWPGQVGNHCMHGCATKKLPNGDWAIKNQNSWGGQWGQNGFCYLTERHFEVKMFDAFGVEVDDYDPQEQHLPPSLV